MKKSIFYIAGACLMLMASCKKELKEKPYSFLTPDNYYTNATDAQTAVNGIFNVLQQQPSYQRTVWLIGELPADNLMPIPTTTSERLELSNFNWTPGNGEILNWWQTSYQAISRANDVILYVPAIKMDTTLRNHLVGNARFLRALCYFDLVRNFGDIPLLLRPILTASDTLLFPSRTAASEVYKAIINDLKFAETNCFAESKITKTYSTLKGMASSGAAATLLAKVYLQRGSTTFADAQDNQNALAELNKVIASKEYSLFPNYSDVFDNAKKNGTEHIFSIQFGPGNNGAGSNIILRMLYPSNLGGAGPFVADSNFFKTGYSADDIIRRKWNMADTVGTQRVWPPFIYKYRDPAYASGSNNSNVNWIVLRYADVLLMQSEALNNIDATDITKFNGVNAIRARAGLTVASQLNFTNTVSQNDFIDSLVKDRARELFVEGHRKYDLIRLKRYKQVMAASRGITVPDYRFLLPIPQTERDVNKNLSQNDGYPK